MTVKLAASILGKKDSTHPLFKKAGMIMGRYAATFPKQYVPSPDPEKRKAGARAKWAKFVPEPIANRFWRKVTRGNDSVCWPWNHAADKKGYGRININGKTALSHRVALELSGVAVPSHLFVCHHCDNPSCCNPSHLFIGTNADNIHDAFNKGRIKRPKGEGCPSHKLTESKVREIRKLYAAGNSTHSYIAMQFGVSKSAVSAILQNRHWKHVN